MRDAAARLAALFRKAVPAGLGLPLALTILLCGVIAAVQCSKPAARAPEHADRRCPDGRIIRIAISGIGSGGTAEFASGGRISAQAAGRSFDLGGKVAVEASGGLLRISEAGLEAGSIALSSSDGILRAGDRSYAGEMALRPGDGGAIIAVNRLPIERYLHGVVGFEMPPDWPLEALKCQAVAARTYAMSRMIRMASEQFDVYDDTRSQVYRGVAPAGHEAAVRAVRETAGLVLTHGGAILSAFFHSTCGGRTESAGEALGGEYPPPLAGVACGFCTDSKHFAWTALIARDEVDAALGIAGSCEIAATARSGTGRALSVVVKHKGGEKRITGAGFRAALGTARIRSTAFRVEAGPGGFAFTGSGFGHGAGMCQWGARGMALAGMNCGEILAKYYPGADVADCSSLD